MVWHSGYSEWFWYWGLNFILAAVAWVACYLNGYYLPGCYVALITLQPFYPLPAALIVFAVFLAEVVAFLAAVLLTGTIIFSVIDAVK